MKIAGIILICLDVLALIMGGVEGELPDISSNGAYGIGQWIGFLIPGIVGVVLLFLSYSKSKK